MPSEEDRRKLPFMKPFVGDILTPDQLYAELSDVVYNSKMLWACKRETSTNYRIKLSQKTEVRVRNWG